MTVFILPWSPSLVFRGSLKKKKKTTIRGPGPSSTFDGILTLSLDYRWFDIAVTVALVCLYPLFGALELVVLPLTRGVTTTRLDGSWTTW